MRIAAKYSHLNGLKYLLVHKPDLWKEIESVVARVDAEAKRTKQSREKRKLGRWLYSPPGLNSEFKSEFKALGWSESRTSYWVSEDARLGRRTLQLPAS